MKYEDLIGCQFKIHGRDKEEGFDCLGLTIEVLRRNGIFIPDLYYDNLKSETEIGIEKILKNEISFENVAFPSENDIIEIMVKDIPSHIAVYIGNGKIIHSLINVGVVIEPLRKYEKRIAGVYKVCNS